MTPDLFIQLLGLIGSALIIGAFCFKADNHYKYLIMAGNVAFSAHFFLLDAYAGAIVNIINIFRMGLSIKYHKSDLLMGGFIAIYVGVAFLTYETVYHILPVVSGIVGSVAVFKLSGIKMRLLMYIGSVSWLTYDIIFKSIGGIITELFAMCTNAITIYRLMQDKKKQEA